MRHDGRARGIGGCDGGGGKYWKSLQPRARIVVEDAVLGTKTEPPDDRDRGADERVVAMA
ncbi:hypothetical protein GB937_006246 [Aspergillus fischeri]|nr:hypothetical protein GB937_006246 [Aspergillus fischeri]